MGPKYSYDPKKVGNPPLPLDSGMGMHQNGRDMCPDVCRAFVFVTMPRGPYQKASEEKRQRIWAAYHEAVPRKSMATIAQAEGLPKSTVQSILAAMERDRGQEPRKPPGRPSKLSKTYVLGLFNQPLWPFFALRWCKRLVILAKRHPFMGAHRLSQEIYESMMATYASMPPGHQFQVCLTCTNNLATNITSQFPPKPCARWVQKILVKEGFRSLRSKKKPLLNKVNRAKRLLFARKYSNLIGAGRFFPMKKSSGFVRVRGFGAG